MQLPVYQVSLKTTSPKNHFGISFVPAGQSTSLYHPHPLTGDIIFWFAIKSQWNERRARALQSNLVETLVRFNIGAGFIIRFHRAGGAGRISAQKFSNYRFVARSSIISLGNSIFPMYNAASSPARARERFNAEGSPPLFVPFDLSPRGSMIDEHSSSFALQPRSTAWFIPRIAAIWNFQLSNYPRFGFSRANRRVMICSHYKQTHGELKSVDLSSSTKTLLDEKSCSLDFVVGRK